MPPTSKQDTAPDLTQVFAGLQIEASSEPLPEPTRGASTGPNPFIDPLKASVEHSSPYNFYVPAVAVQRAVFLINSAARKENLGVRVVVNVQRDAAGKIVKDKKTNKAQYVVEADGPNAGKVLIRFQGKKERKQQTAPRPFTVMKDKDDKSGNTYLVRRRSDKQVVFKGTHEDAKKKYDELKATAAQEATAQPTQESVATQADTATSPTVDATASTQPAE